ncbi:hypothetical protein MAPG_07780 [Magnaporthiopsis poae ATCC 64411]|uniref:Uncharacterized protein n=1 Tax=Magnaporthiopsis poae (strain ATCC 64411 / 73-15) TaxID=644358 RepID=A0A0C4E5K8_MAGP6|nr:hypothetical protein MAPG_07780 [Magnaporthiopsis poae ATCC 64411]
MADRYARLHYEAFRLDRPLLRPTPKLEETVSSPKSAEKITASTPDAPSKPDDPAPPSNAKPPTHAKVPVPLPLSSINTREVYARLDNPAPSRTKKTTTVGPQGLKEPEAPPPKNGVRTCSWCFQRIHPSWVATKNGITTWTSAGRYATSSDRRDLG